MKCLPQSTTGESCARSMDWLAFEQSLQLPDSSYPPMLKEYSFTAIAVNPVTGNRKTRVVRLGTIRGQIQNLVDSVGRFNYRLSCCQLELVGCSIRCLSLQIRIHPSLD